MADVALALAALYAGVIGGLVIWLHIRHTRIEEAHAKLELEAKRDQNITDQIKRLSK